MNPEYALLILKKEKNHLQQEIFNWERNLTNPIVDKKKVQKYITGCKHKLASIDFAIEILEEYMD
jgi:hypothetical protein